jgi:hypothetical protein
MAKQEVKPALSARMTKMESSKAYPAKSANVKRALSEEKSERKPSGKKVRRALSGR